MCRLWGEGGKERLELFERHLHCPMTMASLRLCKAMSAHEHSRPEGAHLVCFFNLWNISSARAIQQCPHAFGTRLSDMLAVPKPPHQSQALCSRNAGCLGPLINTQ